MATQTVHGPPSRRHSGFVYQAVEPRTSAAEPAMCVVVVLEVPAGSAGVSRRAVALADEFGTMMTRLLPGVQARKASITTAGAPVEADMTGGGEPTAHGLLIDVSRRMVTVDGVPVRLAYREFELLKFLCHQPGHVVTRAELLHSVWGDLRTHPSPTLAPVSGRTVDTHVQRLRAKLGSHGRSLVTVRGRGYRFDPSDDARIILARGESRIS